MAKELSKEQLHELEEMYNWNVIILQYFIEEVGNEILKTPLAIVHQTYNDKNLKGMRMVFKDQLEWINGLEENYIKEIDRILKDKLGKGLDFENKKLLKEINKILSRNKVRNEDEYRLLEVRINEIYEDPNYDEEVDKINQLLNEFKPIRDDQ